MRNQIEEGLKLLKLGLICLLIFLLALLTK